MANYLYKLGRAGYRHAWRFIAVWAIILALFGIGAAQLSRPIGNHFTIPGIDSVTTQEKMQELFGTGDLINLPKSTLVLKSLDGKPLSDPEHMTEMKNLVDKLKDAPELRDRDQIVDPVNGAALMAQQLTALKQQQGIPAEQIASDIAAVTPLSADGMVGTIEINLDGEKSTDITAEQREAIINIINESVDSDLQITYEGAGLISPVPESGVSEIIGLLVGALVLVLTFGSLIAAGTPLITAVVGVGLGALGLTISTYFVGDRLTSNSAILASMLGLAVGIDYALFIASRFRTEMITMLGASGMSPRQFAKAMRGLNKEQRAHAMGIAVATAGSAVIFAGATVIIALVALWVVRVPFLISMAMAAAFTVFLSVLVALTLLPALYSLLGTRVFAGNWVPVKVPSPESSKPTMGTRWARSLRKHPVMYTVATVLLLAIMSIPAFSLKLAMPTDGSEAKGSPARISYEVVEEAFGPGRNAPMIVLINNNDVAQDARFGTVYKAVEMLNDTEGVVNAQAIATTDDMSYVEILVTPTSGATDAETSTTLQHIRDDLPVFEAETGATYGVTGMTPIYDDMSERLADALLPYIAIILVLAFVMLMVVFRSIWVPLIATLGFALSVGAAFGATVAVFQWGWTNIQNDPQRVISYIPILLTGLVFGLAMDYEVFLVSRMREEFSHGHEAHHATEMGVKYGARVVTAAAIIMASVFFAFMGIDMLLMRMIGFGLGIAVLFDALIVRMTLVPATMYLLGDRAWKIPSWLKLPHVDIEGANLDKSLGQDVMADPKTLEPLGVK
ncbi:MAG: MMPL family transporter [Corynebacterium sp.]|nr:MMPL family transporter [Corynebacterium sp.]